MSNEVILLALIISGVVLLVAVVLGRQIRLRKGQDGIMTIESDGKKPSLKTKNVNVQGPAVIKAAGDIETGDISAKKLDIEAGVGPQKKKRPD